MAELNVYTMTFNCGRSLIDIDVFAAHIFQGLTLPPDLVVLCLQEIAPISYAFLGGSMLAPYLSRFHRATQLASAKRFGSETVYETIAARNVGMTAIIGYARSSSQVLEKMKWMKTAGVGCGAWSMGNKGAVSFRLGLQLDADEETALTFVSAHLAPMEENWERRNADWRTICEGLIFDNNAARGHARVNGAEAESEPLLDSAKDSEHVEQHSLFYPPSLVFFAGDLNYRTSDHSPSPDDFTKWPQPIESTDDERHYTHLFKSDQLNREKSKKKTLHNLSEARVDFPPTYKYSDAASKHAGTKPLDDASEDQVWLFAKHRVPSWCDRILYLTCSPPTVHAYTALPLLPTSDHRPVILVFSIPLRPLSDSEAAAVKVPYAMRNDWKEARAAARRYEIIVGLAAYLALTWEGELLLAGTVAGAFGGYLLLRALLT